MPQKNTPVDPSVIVSQLGLMPDVLSSPVFASLRNHFDLLGLYLETPEFQEIQKPFKNKECDFKTYYKKLWEGFSKWSEAHKKTE